MMKSELKRACLRFYVLGVALLLATAARGRQAEDLFHDEKSGTLLLLKADGALEPLRGATVKMWCRATSVPSEHNHWRKACTTHLQVERDGHAIARLDNALPDVDFDQVAGNDGRVTLDLQPLDGEAALIAVRASARVGDESVDEHSDEQLLVVDGAGLRVVYQYQPRTAHRAGPDGRDRDSESNIALAGDGGRSRGVRNLVASTDTGRGSEPQEMVLAWDGKSFVPCPTCRPMAPPSPPSPPPPSVTPSPPSRLDVLLAKVLLGKPVNAAELATLSTEELAQLRNAPYARHGRPFKTPSLQAIFYGPRPAGSSLPPLSPNPGYSDALLDAADRANLEMVLAETRRRKH
jgi:hypothetical protein